MKPTLIIMAAGMGSRFGGLKQITPVGPDGEKILDYSVHDAVAAGFGKIVFVIKRSIEQEFREKLGDAIAARVPVEYVFQELDALPEGFCVPAGREKPWGTGHAVLCCRDVVHEPFAVINADDYYGPGCFSLLADFLCHPAEDAARHFAMVGYRLRNTMTENGSVSRGVCRVDPDGRLTGLTERTHIEWKDGVPCYTEDDGKTWTELPEDTWVSMNCWAFPAGTLDAFAPLFRTFLEQHGHEIKSEFYLPFAVDALMTSGQADVRVLPTEDQWYGMTYSADCDQVRAALAAMAERGEYPRPLWK